jgi:purine-binding chemotaxis protein CheW
LVRRWRKVSAKRWQLLKSAVLLSPKNQDQINRWRPMLRRVWGIRCVKAGAHRQPPQSDSGTGTMSDASYNPAAPEQRTHLPDSAVPGAPDATELISFAIGSDQYGVDIMAVREIKGWSEITHLPKQPEYVRGVLNLRGVMVPIIDLRCRFGQGLTDATSMHIVIIVQIENRQVGLLADRVLDIVAFEKAQVQPVPRVAQHARVDFLSGLLTVESGMIALIDLPSLLALREADAAALAD